MNLKSCIQWLTVAGCSAAAWSLTPLPAADPVPAAAAPAGQAPLADGKTKHRHRLPDSWQEFAHLLALPDQELARLYLAAIQGAPHPRHVVALLCAVRDESLRRHLLEKSSWGLMAVAAEFNALLAETGLRSPVVPPLTLGVSEAEWGAMQQLAQQDCAKAVEAVLSRAGLKPGDRLSQLRHVIFIAREKNVVRAAVVLNSLPEEIARLLERDNWESGTAILAATRESLDEALAVQPSLRAGPVRDAITGKIAVAFLQLDPRGAVRWALALDDNDFGQAGIRLRGLLTTARITPGEGTRLYATWPETPRGVKDEITIFAEKASARWDWNDYPYALLDAWTIQAAGDAAAWLASAGGREAAGHIAAESFTRKWCEQDTPAAAAWVQSLPPGALRDYATFGLAGAIAKSQPAEALRSALSIQSPGQRREMIRRLAWNGTRDAAVAEQRLREAGASADEITWALKNPANGMRP